MNKSGFEIKVSPWKPGDRGNACMPLKKNVPNPNADGRHGDWKLVSCPACGSPCWESDLVRHVMTMGAGALCTECALRAGIYRGEAHGKN